MGGLVRPGARGGSVHQQPEPSRSPGSGASHARTRNRELCRPSLHRDVRRAGTGKAGAEGTSLPQVVARALARINALLPGPPTAITVFYNSSPVIPQTGTAGYTSPATGGITIGLGQTPQASFSMIMQLWLPRTLSHEIDHSVRILAGPGFGVSLLEGIISEGISSAFDIAAFPGTPSPWERAITHSQECALWKEARPLLAQSGLYEAWMFGQPGIPHWTAFTIGYDIVTGYRQRHPDMSWSAITAASAATILAGSHYQPCTS